MKWLSFSSSRALRSRLRLPRLLVGVLGRKAVEPAVRPPVGGFHRRPGALRPCPRLGGEGGVARRLRHLGEAAARLDPHALHVDLLVRRVQGPALHPAVAELRVLHEAVAVGIGRGGEAPRLDDRFPGLADVAEISGRAEAVGVGDDVERRGVGAVPRVRVVREPRDEGGALGDLVGDLAVGALELPQEVEGGAAGREVALGVEGEGRPHRVTAEEPGEAGPLALSRRAESREQAAAEERVRGQPLVDPHLRPRERGVEPLVGARHLRRPLLERVVVRDVLSVERGHRAEQPLVVRLRLVLALHAADEEDGQEVGSHALAGDVDHEAQRDVTRLLLVGHDRSVPRPGGPDDGHEALALLGDRVQVSLLVPSRIPRHQPRRPHELQPGAERAGDGHRQRAVHVEEHDDRRLLEGSEHHLPDREGGMRVGEHRGLRPHLHPGHDVGPLDVQRIPFQAERQAEIVDELQRVHPRLEAACLVAEEGRAASHHVEERARADRALQLEAALRHREAGNEPGGGGSGLGQRRGGQQEEEEAPGAREGLRAHQLEPFTRRTAALATRSVT
jgi:hypothetical protein